MPMLALQPSFSQSQTPFGRLPGPVVDLVKFSHAFGQLRSDLASYPSPPMSDSLSPSRRPDRQVVSQDASIPGTTALELRDERRVLQPITTAQTSIAHDQAMQQFHPELHHPRPPFHYQQDARMTTSGSLTNPASQVPPPFNFGYPPAVPFLGSQAPGVQLQPAPYPLATRTPKSARRAKAHVASACINCKRAHLSCDVQRPCARCVSSGKQDTCYDVQHKKRGRPRLRDPAEPKNQEGQTAGRQQERAAIPQSATATQLPRQTRPDQRMLRSRRGASSSLAINPHPAPLPIPDIVPVSIGGSALTHYPRSEGPGNGLQPMAILDLDLLVLKSNQSFQSFLLRGSEIQGMNLSDLVDSRVGEDLQRLRAALRDERDAKEPAYMPPLYRTGEQDAVQSIGEADLDRVSDGFEDRSHIWSFRLSSGLSQPLRVRVRLAKTSIYFVSITLPTTSRSEGFPGNLPPQSPAPLASGTASQTIPSSASLRDVALAPSRRQSPLSALSSSAPSSPYYPSFHSMATAVSSQPLLSPSYPFPQTPRFEPGYYPTYQSPPTTLPTYTPISRPQSSTSEPAPRPRPMPEGAGVESLRLPPIFNSSASSSQPIQSSELNISGLGRDRVRLRESSPGRGDQGDREEAGKRRRVNVQDILE